MINPENSLILANNSFQLSHKETFSLWDFMQKIDLAALVQYIENIKREVEAISSAATPEEKLQTVPDFLKFNVFGQELKNNLQGIEQYCLTHNLPVSAASIHVFIDYRGNLVLTLYTKMDSILEILKIELDTKHCLLLSEEEAKMYNDEQPFGQRIFEDFVNYRDDIHDAHQCFALGQDNASVHLIIGVIEKEVREIKSLFSNWSINPIEWGGIVDELSKKLTKWMDLPRFDRHRTYGLARLMLVASNASGVV